MKKRNTSETNKNLIQEYIKDLKVEGVKLQLQLCSPYDKLQHNDMLGTIAIDELDVPMLIKIVRDAIDRIEMISTYEELIEIFAEWTLQRRIIQYEGYYDDKKRKTEAYCLVFLNRIMRKKHPQLRKIINGR